MNFNNHKEGDFSYLSRINEQTKTDREVKMWSQTGLLVGLDKAQAQNTARILENQRLFNEMNYGCDWNDPSAWFENQFRRISIPMIRRVMDCTSQRIQTKRARHSHIKAESDLNWFYQTGIDWIEDKPNSYMYGIDWEAEFTTEASQKIAKFLEKINMLTPIKLQCIDIKRLEVIKKWQVIAYCTH